MKIQFEIDSNEYKGPFNLDLTINSGQTSQPAWINKNNRFFELVEINGQNCLLAIKQGDYIDGPLEISATGEKLDEDSVYRTVMEIFGLNDDLDDLYKFLRADPKLEQTINFCKGLRLFKAHNPFECIISSISSANCSIKRWNRSINDIKKKWGDRYKFESGNYYTFPSPKILKNVPEHEFEEMQRCEEDLPIGHVFAQNLKSCGVGYRAKYIIESSEMLDCQINIRDINQMNYENAFNSIIKLPGVGPKVADCILLYGFGFGKAFPVDVWIGRIVSKLYFKGMDLKPQKVRLFGMEKYQDFAGYAQLYMFHYARKSGLLDSLKKE